MCFKEKTFLVTGVISRASIAYGIAKALKEKGAEVILTGFGRGMSLTKRVGSLLSIDSFIELDVKNDRDIEELENKILSLGIKEINGAVHSIAFASQNALGGKFLGANISDIEECLRVSAHSYYLIANSLKNILSKESSLIAIDFDGSRAAKGYDWMGVAKSALESINRYLALYLAAHSIRSNLIAAGPINTLAARNIPSFAKLYEKWQSSSPLIWSNEEAVDAVSKAALFLLSENSKSTTGEILHVDGGVNAVLI